MEILDGRKTADEIKENISQQVSKLSFTPVFCDVLVGEDAASAQYVKMKAKAAEKVGYKFRSANYPSTITTENLIEEIKKIGQEENMCGLIVQLPLPEHLDRQAVLDAIDPQLDVDCIGTKNSELFYSGKAYVEFPTAAAIMELLDRAKVNYLTQKFLVMGFGQLVGKPVSFLLVQRGAKVNVARSKTENVLELMSDADVIVSAVGKPGLISGDKIKPGTVIIDAGSAELDGSIAGDADFESIKNKASYISPVPGGVGPVTVAKLLHNVLVTAQKKDLKQHDGTNPK